MTENGKPADNTAIEAALDRLGSALDRLERAATAAPPERTELEDLRRQRDDMRDRVTLALSEVDDLIAEIARNAPDGIGGNDTLRAKSKVAV